MTPTQPPLPLFACPSCGVQEPPRLLPGMARQRAKAVCPRCGTFLHWVPRRLLEQSKGKALPMPGGVNRTILVGVIGRYGVEVRYANSGTACATFTLVVSEQGQDGKTYQTYIPCEIWGRKAEVASELDANQLVVFEGKLRKRQKGEKEWELIVSGFEVTPIATTVEVVT
jgi:hypothetical protein